MNELDKSERVRVMMEAGIRRTEEEEYGYQYVLCAVKNSIYANSWHPVFLMTEIRSREFHLQFS